MSEISLPLMRSVACWPRTDGLLSEIRQSSLQLREKRFRWNLWPFNGFTTFANPFVVAALDLQLKTITWPWWSGHLGKCSCTAWLALCAVIAQFLSLVHAEAAFNRLLTLLLHAVAPSAGLLWPFVLWKCNLICNRCSILIRVHSDHQKFAPLEGHIV